VTVAYICSIELGCDKPPRPEKVRLLCKALGLSFQPMLAKSYVEKRPKELKTWALFDEVREMMCG